MPDETSTTTGLELPARIDRIVINQVTPHVEGGRLAAKAALGEEVPVRACVFSEGQPTLLVKVRWRMAGGAPANDWAYLRLQGRLDDFWIGNITFSGIGPAEFQIEAWRDRFGSWRQDYRRWLRAKADPTPELPTGIQLVLTGAALLEPRVRAGIERRLEQLSSGPTSTLQNYLLSAQLARLMAEALARSSPARSPRVPIWVERSRALFGSWYELFPRSEGSDGLSSGTLVSARSRLAEVAAMKFDVVYLPPIHPIGTTARRGRNNAPVAAPGEPGSPWAIGASAGGHTAVHPDLGSLEDFRGFLRAAEDLGMEVALDYTLQCSPDHPWVQEHPDWFEHRPDGTIRPAENPPKRYDDVFPLDFTCSDWRGLWEACYQILEFWIAQGVQIFRVDNPHTKPVPFWAWVFTRLRQSHPEVILLAEAFTRPALMAELSKVGFSQTYTYFTWRSTKFELRTYLTQLTKKTADYLRPNFFTNTPDILTEELQQGGPPAFRYRLVLAATLSPTYGIYSGYELCENRPQKPKSEEYWDSEKYQYRPRDWSQPGSLASLITQLNQIRRDHPALQQLRRLYFHRTDDPQVLAYSKHTADRADVILVVVNLDPDRVHRATVRLSLKQLTAHSRPTLRVHDLLGGTVATWTGSTQVIELDPSQAPSRIFWVEA
ncbi:MAG TPA: maltotransferase domain-containing protein [Candidatus Dormibacteraeota bacterium]|nr:maltotransferase domain-containing protein [Candidatus Dormibacteraeota bacterium]